LGVAGELAADRSGAFQADGQAASGYDEELVGAPAEERVVFRKTVA
jgi:hypothetical protein